MTAPKIMTLYGFILGSEVWGIGDTEERAREDARAELAKWREKQGDTPKLRNVLDALYISHTGRCEPISLETAKRVANGDRRLAP